LCDRWLAEASYKNNVKSGMADWKCNFTQMAELFHDLIALDSHRRTRTKEALLSFIPRRRKILLRISELIAPSKTDLENGRSTRDEYEQEIEKALQQLSRVNLAMKPNRSSIMNRSRTSDIDIGSPVDLQPLAERNLFDNHRVIGIKAIEFQRSDKSLFEIGLAVTTSDGFLHIVGGDAYSDVVLTAASFHGDAKQAEIELKDKFNNRLPAFSLFLSECQYWLADDNFRIKISVKRKSARPVEEKVTLRLFSPRETFQWWREWLEPWTKEQQRQVTA
jgi:hypothetical protein